MARTMRPRFRVAVDLTPDEVVARFARRLSQPDCPCRGQIAANHHTVELCVLERDRHFWSPTLGVTAIDEEDGRCTVHGLIGPDPAVWTMFAMGYLGLCTVLGFVALFGLLQWWLGLPAWGLWGVPALLAGIAGMYLVSRLGQRLAAPQTVLLRHALEEVLDLPPSERAVTDADPYHEVPAEGADPDRASWTA